MKEKILTVKDLAQYLKMDEHTVYRLARKGVLPGVKIGGEWRFKKNLIDKWIEEGSLKNIKDKSKEK
ncbi:MAG TPA: DNA-binding protein [Candidatus Desulfofervidus auxilii]|uniref:DNA-binding protein n=1 Tax=Desulfofervidus auxilii TaxID=1621989 RepID=A0A7C1ZE15_DESA2|nr:DNA-binding protein [Candidatus Desulfofervidus auxilii]HEC67390.1 DNA-binding protein [Candidatus Desulfofervidus auxilii]